MTVGDIALIGWCFVTPVCAYVTATAFLHQRRQRYWIMLFSPMIFYLVTDAIFVGGFHLDGVTSFPAFLGILASILWFVIYILCALGGALVRDRRTAKDAPLV